MHTQLSVLVCLASCALVWTVRQRKHKHVVASVDCGSLADLVVDGIEFGVTLERVCQFWPKSLGEFPVSDVNTAGDLLNRVVEPGGVWDQIQQIRDDHEDRGFCWRNNTVRAESTGECPLGYAPSGLTANFERNCKTGCMWSTHPLSCGFGCATERDQCSSAIVDQVFIVAQGVASVYGFVVGDDRIGRAVAAIIELAEFLLVTLPPISDAVQGALDIINGGHGAMVAVILFQYLQETAPDVREPAEAIRDAIQYFGDIIARLSEEQVEKGTISVGSIIREILDHGEEMLDYATRAVQVFTHPTCSITDNVAFTMEVAGDDRLLGPWIARGEIEGKPRYTLLGDRRTNLEWSTANGLSRWVMFSDTWTGYIGRRFLYQSSVPSADYPMSGWSTLQGEEPLPEFVPVRERVGE